MSHVVTHLFVSALRTNLGLQIRRPEEPGSQAPEIVGYVISGPPGSGKTSQMRKEFGIDMQRIGSDRLKEGLAGFTDGFLPFDVIHLECSNAAWDLVNDISHDMRGIYLFDTTLARAEDVRRPLRAMGEAGRLHVMGLHVPLHITLLRVLGRRVIDRDDPRIPYGDVVAGWERTVVNRRELCDAIKENPDNADYELYIANNTGTDYRRVTTIKGGQETVADPQRWESAVQGPDAQFLDELRQVRLRDLLADRTRVAEDTALIFDRKFAGRPLPWEALSEPEQAAMRRLEPEAEAQGWLDFRALPLSIALDLNARRQAPWLGELSEER
jgi:hypothetical protein